MREVEITLGDRTLRLAANYKASMEIAKTVGDPLTIMREAALEAMFIDKGIAYEPKWRFSVANVTMTLAIGLRAAGSSMKQAELEDLIFEAGFADAKNAAAEYLGIIVGPKPEEVTDKEGEASGN